MAKPEPNDADRRRAERISVWLREQGIVAKGIQGVDSAHLWNKAREMFAAEFAAVREAAYREGYNYGVISGKNFAFLPGPCGKHPKACLEVDLVRIGGTQPDTVEYCTACEREKPLVEALESVESMLSLLASRHVDFSYSSTQSPAFNPPSRQEVDVVISKARAALKA